MTTSDLTELKGLRKAWAAVNRNRTDAWCMARDAYAALLLGNADALIAAADECQELRAQRDATSPCRWRESVSEGYWEGDCGLAWDFPNGTPEMNECWFCPRCGRRVDSSAVGKAKP